jgi:choice-of-anchor B domain-containing protein
LWSRLLIVAGVVVTPGVSTGQDMENVTVLGNVAWSSWHADIWGYAVDGVEICFLGAYSETHIYDVTDPTDPVLLEVIDGPDSIWRDIKTYGTHAYIVNDDLGLGGPGIQIVDLADPLNPVLVNEVDVDFETAHNVWIDVEAGLLFAVGADFDGTYIYDLTADPVNPTLIYVHTGFYTHDMYSRDGVAYMAAIYDGDLVTMDMTALPGAFPELDRIQTDGAFTHNVWLTQDGNYAVTGDEVSGGPMTVIDVSDPANLSRVTSWAPPNDPSATMHNVIVRGNLAYIGWYNAGFHVVDLTDPSNPQEVAYFDSAPGSGSGYNGSWGSYPFAPSGVVYMSDIDAGLYTLEIDVATVLVPGAAIPTGHQLVPLANPFQSSTSLRITLDGRRDVRLEVVDAEGRRVRRLLDGSLATGTHDVSWDGRDLLGRPVEPGVYFVNLRAGGATVATKLVRTR